MPLHLCTLHLFAWAVACRLIDLQGWLGESWSEHCDNHGTGAWWRRLSALSWPGAQWRGLMRKTEYPCVSTSTVRRRVCGHACITSWRQGGRQCVTLEKIVLKGEMKEVIAWTKQRHEAWCEQGICNNSCEWGHAFNTIRLKDTFSLLFSFIGDVDGAAHSNQCTHMFSYSSWLQSTVGLWIRERKASDGGLSGFWLRLKISSLLCVAKTDRRNERKTTQSSKHFWKTWKTPYFFIFHQSSRPYSKSSHLRLWKMSAWNEK